MGRNFKLEKLQAGESFVTSEKGNSMVPLIKSGQEHKLQPATWKDVEVGDIAYAKVRGNFYTHLVTAKDEQRGCQISNNQGYVNGWTKAVYGVVVEVTGSNYKRKVKMDNDNKGHFCYGCNEYFHDSNPLVKSHEDCKENKSLGICVDKKEFEKPQTSKLPEHVIMHSPDMIIESYIYKNKFRFTRMAKNSMWYVTFDNCIVTHGQYRHDLEGWIDVTYKLK